MKKLIKLFLLFCFAVIAANAAMAAPANPLAGQLNVNQLLEGPQFSQSVQMILSLSAISLVPFFLMSVTSFLRIIIVLSLLRTALGTANVPPGPVIISLAVFMTVFIMTPVWQEANTVAITPYNQGKISMGEAFNKGMEPLKKFMLKQTREKDLALFVQFSKIKTPKTVEEVPVFVVIPAYMISELKTAFQIGFLLFIPFIIIDLVVANILLSLGMFMLSPVMVSLPFKILLFVLVDGWNIIIRGLLLSFR